MHLVLASIGAALLAACEIGPEEQPDQPEQTASARTSAPSGAKQFDCEAAGGAMQSLDAFGGEVCAIHHKDAGKLCTDSDQCDGPRGAKHE